MDSLTIFSCFVAALFASCDAAPVADGLAVLVRSPITVNRGHTATLPCWISPQRSAEDLEVRWYRSGHFDSPAILYRENRFHHALQNPSYVGRVSFGSESSGLKTGDVSLELVNVSLEDAGNYSCYVSGDQDHDHGIVSLRVQETGSPLLLSAVWREDDLVNVSCESAGWYPKPGLRWSDQEKALTPKRLEYSKDSSGLLSVHSWLLVSSDSKVSCSVGLSGEKEKVASLRLNNPPQPDKQNFAAPAAPGWIAFALLLLATLALLGLWYYKNRVKKQKLGSDQETKSLLTERNTVSIQQTDLSPLKKAYVNVTLTGSTGSQYLIVKDVLVRDSGDYHLENVTCLTAINGTPSFSSGQHYWEVSLGNPDLGLKRSWWVGITTEADIPQDPDFSPSASNGFFFLSSSPDMPEYSLRLSTEPSLTLRVPSRPQTVGVYLDYDGGELSFYHVEEKYLIGRLTANFKGEMFPLFNPGLGDKAPLKILHVNMQEGQASNKENAGDARG